MWKRQRFEIHGWLSVGNEMFETWIIGLGLVLICSLSDPTEKHRIQSVPKQKAY